MGGAVINFSDLLRYREEVCRPRHDLADLVTLTVLPPPASSSKLVVAGAAGELTALTATTHSPPHTLPPLKPPPQAPKFSS